MKTPNSVKKAMRAMGMTSGEKVEKVVAENVKMLKKENEAINKHNNKVYENKKNNLTKVANIVKKFENMKLKNEKVEAKANAANTKVKKMARNYNNKVKK